MTARKRSFSLKRTSGLALGALVVVAALAGGGWYWYRDSQYRSTENAYVNARIVQVSSLVMGQVVEVPVHENQYVHAGDVLFELDARPFQAALDEALGKLHQAEQGTRQDSSELLATEADAARASSDLVNADANLRRTSELVRQN
ncbi:MAG: biotin/lipoyl-binding protein, partial [Casimicrobiaceae bacterium]